MSVFVWKFYILHHFRFLLDDLNGSTYPDYMLHPVPLRNNALHNSFRHMQKNNKLYFYIKITEAMFSFAEHSSL